jgi:hypothetical protein
VPYFIATIEPPIIKGHFITSGKDAEGTVPCVGCVVVLLVQFSTATPNNGSKAAPAPNNSKGII